MGRDEALEIVEEDLKALPTGVTLLKSTDDVRSERELVFTVTRQEGKNSKITYFRVIVPVGFPSQPLQVFTGQEAGALTTSVELEILQRKNWISSYSLYTVLVLCKVMYHIYVILKVSLFIILYMYMLRCVDRYLPPRLRCLPIPS